MVVLIATWTEGQTPPNSNSEVHGHLALFVFEEKHLNLIAAFQKKEGMASDFLADDLFHVTRYGRMDLLAKSWLTRAAAAAAAVSVRSPLMLPTLALSLSLSLPPTIEKVLPTKV